VESTRALCSRSGKKEETGMKLTNHERLFTGRWMGLLWTVVCLMGMSLGSMAQATVSTTTVQGTVYLANGEPATGTVVVSWPSFTTASGQLVAADSMTATIAPDGFVSVNLAPNQGATPAGQYYTATYYLSDGTTSTEYWVVPAAAQATLGAIQAQVMPAAQAVQTVSKAYVDQAIAGFEDSMLSVSGGTLSGPLYLNADPTQPLQAADKHYVDEEYSLAVPLTGAAMTGPLTSIQLGALYQVDQFSGADFGAKLAACLSGLSLTNGGTCDARNFTGTLSMGSNLTISTGNATVLLPCATISTANQVIVTAGTRNVSLRGCSLRGASTASGSQGGTVFFYSGKAATIQVGDPTYAADTMGFHLDNAVINTTASSSATAQGFVAYRTQELDLESLYFLGNSNQTGMTLDGTGNYTGGTFLDNAFNGFQAAVNAIGHQVSNSATTDWMNASTFVRLHIDCPTSGGSPISGSYGINLQQGDGNTFTGGDVEGCGTALHLGANAQNNTIIGLRNENSTNQVVADAGSAYNNWMTGGTMFTGQLTDNGTRNSFLDTFHRSFNGLNGDWYGSQKDATVTNHYRIGIGTGNERGLLSRYQTDYGYRWTIGLSDATAGEQFYQIQDELNNVYRLSIGQYNNGQSSTNNQTVINAAGTGAIVLNGSNNSGTGGVVFGSGGPSETTVATINSAGNAQFIGTLQVGGATTFISTPTVKNQADAEIDSTLWAGLTTSQKESFIYKDWNGNSQWYMVKDASNNWALNSATGGLDSFKAYQSTNSGDTYINASNSSGVVRVNYESGAGTGFNIYGGSSSSLYASFTGTTAIKFPGLAASSGHNCLQIDNSGYITNTGSACGSGSGGSGGTINSGSSGQIAYYTAAGTTIGGVSTVPLTAGGTGATTAAGAVSNLIPGATLSGSGSTQVISLPGSITANTSLSGPTATVGQLNGVFSPLYYVGQATSTMTAADLAFNAAVAWARANGGAELDLGPYQWNFCNNGQGWVLPIREGGASSLSIIGEGSNLSVLNLTCPISRTVAPTGSTGDISQAALWQPSTSSATFDAESFHFANFQVNAQYLAPSVLDLTGNVYLSSLEHLWLGNAAGDGTSTSHIVQIGGNTSGALQGWSFQVFLNDIAVDNQMHGALGSSAAFSVSLSGGVPTVSVTNGGTNYSTAGTVTWLQGYGVGATPCTTMGTLTPTISSGVITAVTASGFSGCTGTVEALAYDAGADTNYGIYFGNWSDSTANNLQAGGGQIASIYNTGGNDAFYGAHPCCGAPANIIETGKNAWYGTDQDSPGGYGFVLGANAHPLISGTMHYWNGSYPGSSDYYIPQSADAVIVGDLYGGNQSAGDYHQIVTYNGALDHYGSEPQGTIPTSLVSSQRGNGSPNDYYYGYSYMRDLNLYDLIFRDTLTSSLTTDTTTGSATITQTAQTQYDGSAATGTNTAISTLYFATKITPSSTYYVGSFGLRLKAAAGVTNPTQSITGYIYSDNSGVPGSVLATGSAIKLGSISTSYAVYQFGGTSLQLSGGTSYWLVGKLSALPTGTTVYMDSGSGTSKYATAPDGSTWTTSNAQLYLMLYGRTGAAVSGSSTNGYGLSGSSTASTGVYGSSTNGTGIYGLSTNYHGVWGYSANETGVRGDSVNGSGVVGSSTSGYGVYGQTSSGTGVYGLSSTSTGVSGISTSSYGTYGQSASNSGVYGSSGSSDGVTGSSSSGAGVRGTSLSYIGIRAQQTGTLTASTSSPTLYSVRSSTLGSYTSTGAIVRAEDTSGSTGNLFEAAENGTILYSIDHYGNQHQIGTAPTASSGTVTGTNAGGYVSGLSAATSVTITFANSGWSSWASCVANTSVASTQPYVSAISKTAVTFTFASLTGTLYYQCNGN